ncbi:hypothetical protein DFH28DRAFT_1131712 [Melampsora americana]|nr:hypothetical protein DFH28DRAFT_1131712 [Melampsora americana]
MSAKTKTTITYPNPIPPPPTDQVFDSHQSAGKYLNDFAFNHGFELGILDTREPTSTTFKCSLGPHRHKTKSAPVKTCPFRIISRRNPKDHRCFTLILHLTSLHHDHGPTEVPLTRQKIITIPTVPSNSTSLLPSFPPSSSSSIVPRNPLNEHVTVQYTQLLNKLQSLLTEQQSYLIARFIRDCEFARDLNSLTKPGTSNENTLNNPTRTQTQPQDQQLIQTTNSSQSKVAAEEGLDDLIDVTIQSLQSRSSTPQTSPESCQDPASPAGPTQPPTHSPGPQLTVEEEVNKPKPAEPPIHESQEQQLDEPPESSKPLTRQSKKRQLMVEELEDTPQLTKRPIRQSNKQVKQVEDPAKPTTPPTHKSKNKQREVREGKETPKLTTPPTLQPKKRKAAICMPQRSSRRLKDQQTRPSTFTSHPDTLNGTTKNKGCNLSTVEEHVEVSSADMNTLHPSRRSRRPRTKKECQKKLEPEFLKVLCRIEEIVLKDWPFMKTVPRYIFPFVRSATDVPGDGLCAFSSISVSIGGTSQEAPEVRKQMSLHVQSKYDWYKTNCPIIGNSTFDIGRIQSILDLTELTAPPELWFPMPMGGYIIANTYNCPVVFYSPHDASSSLIFPTFSNPKDHPDTTPIVLAFINKGHFIALELIWNFTPPIPPVHPEWQAMRDPIAQDWSLRYQDEIRRFQELKWQREWEANQSAPPVDTSSAVEVE